MEGSHCAPHEEILRVEYYFAYGSNMSPARLKKRAPSSLAIGIAQLAKHALHFHKRSKDGVG
jgi:hypothetical protein